MTDAEAKAHLTAALEPLGLHIRAMFGGYGLYLGGRFFGIINEGRVYFRADDRSRREYESRGMGPFQPNNRAVGPKTVPRNFEVPPEVLGDPERLAEWALRAAEARPK